MERLQFDLPLDIRAVPTEGDETSDGRTVEGRIVPYGETVTLGGSQESFARGVFADTDPDSIVLLWQHATNEPIGRMVALTEAADGAYARFRLADTTRARESLSLIRDGVIRGLSIGFEPGQTRKSGRVREHIKARLAEVSLVTYPAYPTAGVLAVRQEEEMEEETTAVEEPDAPRGQMIDMGQLSDQLLGEVQTLRTESDESFREVRNQIANIVTTAPAVEPPMTLNAALAELMRLVAEKPAENRALADVVGTAPGNASGLIRDAWVSGLLGYLDSRRPLFSAAGSVGFPASGYGIAFPRITQHALVGPRGAEKSEIPSREVIVESGNYTMKWFAGGVDVALELISQSDPSVVEVVTSSLLDQYSIATEQAFVDDAEAAATAAGTPIVFTNWGAFVGSVLAGNTAIRTATGQAGDRVALNSASWGSLMAMLNPAVPASLPGPSAPDFNAESVSLFGVTFFHVPLLDATSLQFNQKSLRKSEKAPDTVTATNVALMGRDIGVLGATIHLPLYPAGILRSGAA